MPQDGERESAAARVELPPVPLRSHWPRRTWQGRLAAWLAIQPGEGGITGLLLLHSVLNGFGKTFFNTAAFAIFLTHFDAALLPYAYVGGAIVGPAAGVLFGKLQERVSFRALMVGTLLVLAGSAVIFRAALASPAALWPVAALLVWNEPYHTFLELQFWGVAEHSYNVRQAKRLFGLIGSGEVAAGIAGGLAVPLLVTVTGTANLLLLAAVGLAGSCAVLSVLLHRHQLGEPEAAAEDAPAASAAQPAARRLAQRYVRWTIGLALLATLAYFVVDTAYFAEVEHRFAGAEAMAGFIGVFDAGTDVLTFVVRFAVAGRLMARFGVTFGLMLPPVMLLASSGALSLWGTVVGPGMVVFVLVSLSKLVLEVLGEALDRPAMLTLYQPLPGQLRLRAMNLVESFAQPIGQGLAGALIIGVGVLTTLDAVSLSYLAVLLLVGAILVRPRVGRLYVQMLGSGLARQVLARSAIAFDDHALRHALRQGLTHPHPGQALYCLQRLEEQRDQRLDDLLVELVSHPAPDVRAEAARRIERLRVVDAYGAVVRQQLRESDVTVRAALLRTAVALEPAEARHRVGPYLDRADSESRPLRLAALASLLCHAMGAVHDDAMGRLERLADSAEADDRRLAAELAGRVRPLSGMRVLPALLRDPDAAVRVAALEAAARINLSSLWPQMIANLELAVVRRAAFAAVTAAGPAIVPAIERTLARAGLPDETRELLLRALGRIGGERAAATLWAQLQSKSVRQRAQALRALALLEYTATEAQRETVRTLLAQEAASAAVASMLLEALTDAMDGAAAPHFSAHEAMRLAKDTAAEELRTARERAFLAAGLHYDRRALADALANAESILEDRRASAVELLDNLLAHEHKPYVLPLVEGLSAGERADQLCRAPGVAAHISWAGPAARELSLPSLMQAAAQSALLSEWTLRCASYAAAIRFPQGVQAMPTDVIVPRDRAQERESMLSTLERLLLLKRVALFQRTPDLILADVAESMTELELAGDERLMREGEPAEFLYVIAAGTLALTRGGRLEAVLGEGEVVGELEALDPRPRVRTATAVTGARVLSLHRDLLFHLMEEHPEVAHGIVEYLIRRYAHATVAHDTHEAGGAPVAAGEERHRAAAAVHFN